MASKRPIDAPSPPWRLMPERPATDEVPHPDAEAAAPQVDKAGLARRLAAEAKAKVAERKAADVAKRKEKADLARKLVEEARKATPMSAPVKRAAPSPAASIPEPIKAQEAPSEPKPNPAKAAEASPAPKPKPAPKSAQRKSSLAERAGRPVKKNLSAQEALAAALAAEVDTEVSPVPAAPKAAPSPPAQPKAASQEQAPGADAPAGEDRAAALAAALPGGELIGAPISITKTQVFSALWKAHRSKAQQQSDPTMLSTANVLLAAVEATSLTAYKVKAGGITWAVWLNASGELIAAATPADTYLAGM